VSARKAVSVALAVMVVLVAGFLLRGRARGSRYPRINNTFIVNQTMCLPPQIPDANGACKPTTLTVGSTLEVQLPGNPATWTIVSTSPNLTPSGQMAMDNAGRIDGTSQIFTWDFKVARAGTATLVMHESPPTISGTPSGVFTYTFQIQ
jgi:predicted secreted protein